MIELLEAMRGMDIAPSRDIFFSIVVGCELTLLTRNAPINTKFLHNKIYRLSLALWNAKQMQGTHSYPLDEVTFDARVVHPNRRGESLLTPRHINLELQQEFLKVKY